VPRCHAGIMRLVSVWTIINNIFVNVLQDFPDKHAVWNRVATNLKASQLERSRFFSKKKSARLIFEQNSWLPQQINNLNSCRSEGLFFIGDIRQFALTISKFLAAFFYPFDTLTPFKTIPSLTRNIIPLSYYPIYVFVSTYTLCPNQNNIFLLIGVVVR
jgi:hypothetical protein